MNNVLEYVVNNQKSLVSHLNKMCKDYDTAEDLYQDVSEAVLRYVKENMKEEEIPNYVYTCCNRAYHKFKEKDLRVIVGDEHVALTFHQLHEDKLDECTDPLDRLIAGTAQENIPETIEQFAKNDEHANLLKMIFCEDVSINTAADLCGLERGHARVIMYRFMKSMADTDS